MQDNEITQLKQVDGEEGIREGITDSSDDSLEALSLTRTDYPANLQSAAATLPNLRRSMPLPDPFQITVRHGNIDIPFRGSPPPGLPPRPQFAALANNQSITTTTEGQPFYRLEVLHKKRPLTIPQNVPNDAEIVVGPPSSSPNVFSSAASANTHQRVFYVSEKLLTQHSETFNQTISTQSVKPPASASERTTYRFYLPTTQPHIFQHFVDYMKSLLYNPSPAHAGAEAIKENVLCWTLGKEVGCSPFRDAALHKLNYLLTHKRHALPQAITLAPETIDFMIQSTEIGSAIRRLYFDFVASKTEHINAEPIVRSYMRIGGQSQTGEHTRSTALTKAFDFGRHIWEDANLEDCLREGLLADIELYISMGSENMTTYTRPLPDDIRKQGRKKRHYASPSTPEADAAVRRGERNRNKRQKTPSPRKRSPAEKERIEEQVADDNSLSSSVGLSTRLHIANTDEDGYIADKEI